jgi:thioredoxin reductase (NADPH)
LVKTDIVIIGGGPVGIFTVFQAGMLGMKSVVIEALDYLGGQCTALYPEKPIYDIPAYPKVLAKDLVNNLLEQAAPFNPTYLLGNKVESIVQDQEGLWNISTDKGEHVQAKVIVIAAGCGSFGPNRLPLAEAEQFEGKSVLYFIDKKDHFKDKQVVIGGGGDSAVDWAIILAEVAKKVYVVHRRDKFRAFDNSIEQLHNCVKSGKVELVIPFQISGLKGAEDKLSAVEVEDMDGNKRTLVADYLLPFYGLKMELGAILNWGLELQKNHIVVDASTMQTNLPGVYAVGDIATYRNKLKLILTGFSEVALAMHSAYNNVFPNKALHFEYSTTRGMPEASK